MPVSKAVLVKDVWGVDSYASDDALKVRISPYGYNVVPSYPQFCGGTQF